MRTMKSLVKVLFFAALPLFSWLPMSAQNAVTGNGNVIEHPIAVEEYSNIEFEANADLYYELKMDVASDFRMEIDENLIPFVEVTLKKEKLTRKEKLVIKTTSPIKPTKFVIYTNSRIIKDIEMKGSGNVYLENDINSKDMSINLKGYGNFKAENLQTKSFSLDVSGAGSAILKGTSQSVDLKIGKKGSGSIDASELQAEEIKCDISGTGNMDVNVQKSLDIKIDGSGNVSYKGDPRNYSHKLSGTGNVKHITDK